MKRTTLPLLALALLLGFAKAPQAQTPVPPPTAAPAPTFEQRLAARAAENRYAVTFQNGAFSGPGWDLLLAEGRAARFFLVGEEHGVAEIRFWQKSYLGIPSPYAEEMAAQCDAVINGVGH